MGMLELPSGTQTGQESIDQLLFNERNLAGFVASLQGGLEAICQRLVALDKPFSGIQPAELARQFDGLDLDSALGSAPAAIEELQHLYLKDAVYFHHPRYMAHLNCPVAYPAILAELILSSINSSVDTWDQSAGATLIEQKLVDWTVERIGLGSDADGVFTSGGTQSNLMGLLLARERFCRQRWPGYSTKEQGLPADAHRFRIFTSEVSHFSVQKSAAILGLGYRSVVTVPCDSRYRMSAAALETAVTEAQQEGLIPIAVVATAGTTDFGSIDPLESLGAICRSHGLWMHVDAAYGCGLLVSDRRAALNGIAQADSVTVDYHKSFLQPVSCSAFFAKDKTDFACVTHYAEYLNPLSAEQEGTPNLVNKSMQTTRRFDALKLWLTLRIAGANRIGEAFDKVCELATDTYERYADDPQIECLHRPELSTLVYRYLPSRNQRVERGRIDEINEQIRRAIFNNGDAVIAGTKVNGRSFLKFTLLNPATGSQDIDAVFELVKRHGDRISSLYSGSTTSLDAAETADGVDLSMGSC